MIARVASVDAMVAVGVYILLEVLVGLYESLGVFGRIAEVHIVVGHTVAYQPLRSLARIIGLMS